MLDFLTRTLLALPMSYFSARRTGDIQRRLAGAREIREFLVESGIGGLLDAAQLAVVLGLMAGTARLCRLFLLTVPLYAGLMVFSARVLKPIFVVLEESYGRYSSPQIDAIKGIEAVKAPGAEDSLRAAHARRVHGARASSSSGGRSWACPTTARCVARRSSRRRSSSGPAPRRSSTATLTIGGFVAFNALVAIANAPILGLLGLWDELQPRRCCSSRLNDVFENEPEQGAGPLAARAGAHARGPRRVPERRLPLRRARVPADPPRHLARGAPRAHGRHRRAERLRQDDADQVPLGAPRADRGDDPLRRRRHAHARYRDLRRQIGFVLQENYLFDDTIARNIAFGDPSARPGPRPLGGARRERPRVHRAPAARLRDPDRRVRARALRRAAPAGRDRPRALPPPAGPDLRRGDERARHRVGARHQGEPRRGCSTAGPSSSSRTA